MHRRSIFHNNLNLDNILLSKRGGGLEMGVHIEAGYQMMIIDWGNARLSTN